MQQLQNINFYGTGEKMSFSVDPNNFMFIKVQMKLHEKFTGLTSSLFFYNSFFFTIA